MADIVIQRNQQLVFKKKMKNELTLAIPTVKVWDVITYQEKGVIRALDSDIMDKLLRYGVFKYREELEQDPSYKQIIPYAVMCCADEVYMFKRLAKQTEARLHNKCSLGVGGHMNPYGDSIDTAYLHHELEREMNEEVKLSIDCNIEDMIPVGFINDDISEVGRVHLGVLYHINLSNKNVVVNETDKMTGEWIPKNKLEEYYSNMETWSQLYCNLIGICDNTL